MNILDWGVIALHVIFIQGSATGAQPNQLAGRPWAGGVLLYLNRRSNGPDAEVRSIKLEG